MLFRTEKTLLILLAAVIGCGIVGQSGCKKQPPVSPEKSKLPIKQVPHYSSVELERYSGTLLESFSAADLSENELANNIRQCAANTLKAVLPEKSIVLAPLEIELLAEQTALVSCRAAVFNSSGSGEQILQCRVKINYLPSGSCEAEYPEFFSDK